MRDEDEKMHDQNEHIQHNAVHKGHSRSMGFDKVKVDWQIVPEHLTPDQQVEITLTVKDNMGVPSPAFAVVHEKQMHLLVISQDLSFFQHLHPDYLGEGVFAANAEFPQAGKYKLFAEFTPEGSSQQLATHELHVSGKEVHKPVHQNDKLQKTINGVNFKLKVGHLVANQDVDFSFSVADAKTGENIEDLQPYLGSAGHVVIVSEDLEDLLHVHPTDESSKGPTVSYVTHFPKAGIYKIWGQFKYKSNLYTVSFVINVI